MRIAVLSDVHGNRWALKAVMNDIDRRGVDAAVDLGDSLYGPLDPAGTADLLIARGVESVRGNEDRVVLAPAEERDSTTLRFTRSELSREHLRWLAKLPMRRVALGDLLCCHGTPLRDDEYLLENVASGSPVLRAAEDVAVSLAGVTESVVLCGHSHLARVALLPDGKLIVNPGSVGLPAYADATPPPHAMQAGSPHARYAVLERTEAGWRAELVAVPYDWDAAARTAQRNGRADWSEWLRAGRASV